MSNCRQNTITNNIFSNLKGIGIPCDSDCKQLSIIHNT